MKVDGFIHTSQQIVMNLCEMSGVLIIRSVIIPTFLFRHQNMTFTLAFSKLSLLGVIVKISDFLHSTFLGKMAWFATVVTHIAFLICLFLFVSLPLRPSL